MPEAREILTIVKHAFAIQREPIDWSDYKAKLPAGTTLQSMTVHPPAGVTAESLGVSGDIGTMRLSGGTAGTRYNVVCRTNWSNGDTDDRTFVIDVRQVVLAAPDPIRLDPDADRVYDLNWAALLAKVGGGATIAGHEWPATPNIAIDNLALLGSVSEARLSAITLGARVIVENQVTLSNGDRDARNLLVWGRQT